MGWLRSIYYKSEQGRLRTEYADALADGYLGLPHMSLGHFLFGGACILVHMVLLSSIFGTANDWKIRHLFNQSLLVFLLFLHENIHCD